MARTQSLTVLKRKIRELQAKAERLQKAERPGIPELRAVMKKFKLGQRDVQNALNSLRSGALQGRKVKPKYRNPDRRSETWTGRGRMPLWMAAFVKKGKKPQDFLISKG
jgi:DNA-binding protein H-NS